MLYTVSLNRDGWNAQRKFNASDIVCFLFKKQGSMICAISFTELGEKLEHLLEKMIQIIKAKYVNVTIRVQPTDNQAHR